MSAFKFAEKMVDVEGVQSAKVLKVDLAMG
jgi:hypothetical protein